MRARFVFSQIGNGLRRNLAMATSVVLVTFISLAFVGAAILLQMQISNMKDDWYDRVEVSIFLCPASSSVPNCASGEATEEQVAELRKERDALVARQQPQTVPDPEASELAALAAGQLPVTGPGVVVELWDAPAPPDLSASGLHPDDLVVHQQDLEAVINALWAGGAEAMMIQDQRITTTSSVRCVGNVLLLHGRHYSPPYRVSAIGDPQELTAAVDSSPGVAVYLQYADAYGLGWSMTEAEDIDMPAYTGSLRLEHARAG